MTLSVHDDPQHPTRRDGTSRRNPSDAPSALSAPSVLALGAIAGPALFTLAWLVLGFISTGYTVGGTRIDPYCTSASPSAAWAWARRPRS